MKAADEFKDKTTAPNQLWQTDFTYLNASSGLRSVLVRSTKMPSSLRSSLILSGSIAKYSSLMVLRYRRIPVLPTSALSPLASWQDLIDADVCLARLPLLI
jgi:hypothetical protein